MFNSITGTYKDFLSFLKNPTDEQDVIQTKTQKIKRVLSLLAIDIPVMGILISIISYFDKLHIIDTNHNKIEELFNQFPVWILIFLLVIIGPMIEEIIFRLYLRFRHNFLIQAIVYTASFTGNNNKNAVKSYLKAFWQNKFIWIFYFSAILFAFAHISNYRYSRNLLFLSPLLVAPQFLVGLFAGYLRVKYNLTISYLMHALHNSVFAIIPLITMSIPVEKINVKNKEYSLHVEELYKKESTTITTFSDNTITFKSEKMKNIIAYLANKDQTLIKGDESILNKTLHVDFKHFLQNSSNNKNIILTQISKAYHFTTKNILEEKIIWKLQVADSLLLEKHKSASVKDPDVIEISAKNIVFKDVLFENILKTLAKEFNCWVELSENISGKYSLTIPKTSFTELNQWLTLKYGLQLQKEKKQIEYINIIQTK